MLEGDEDFIIKWNPEADESETKTTAASNSFQSNNTGHRDTNYRLMKLKEKLEMRLNSL